MVKINKITRKYVMQSNKVLSYLANRGRNAKKRNIHYKVNLPNERKQIKSGAPGLGSISCHTSATHNLIDAFTGSCALKVLFLFLPHFSYLSIYCFMHGCLFTLPCPYDPTAQTLMDALISFYI